MRPIQHDEAAPTRLVPNLQWQASYELESVDRFIADIEDERLALEEQIHAARQRLQRAQAGMANRAAAEKDLGARILAAQEEFETLQREHRDVIDAIAAGAEEEAGRILAAAHKEAAALRTAAAVAARFDIEGVTPPARRLASSERHDP